MGVIQLVTTFGFVLMGPGSSKGRKQKGSGLVSPKGPWQNIAVGPDTARGCRAGGAAGRRGDPSVLPSRHSYRSSPGAVINPPPCCPQPGNRGRGMPGVYPALTTTAVCTPGGGSPPAALQPGCSAASAVTGVCEARLRHRGQSNVSSQEVAAGWDCLWA